MPQLILFFPGLEYVGDPYKTRYINRCRKTNKGQVLGIRIALCLYIHVYKQPLETDRNT